MYLLYIYFIFKLTKTLPYFTASNQHFTGMPEYIKHMILNTLQVFYIYNKNNVHHFSLFYNISIFSFISLCASNSPRARGFLFTLSRPKGLRIGPMVVCKTTCLFYKRNMYLLKRYIYVIRLMPKCINILGS